MVGKWPTNCLSKFDHFVGVALKSLINPTCSKFQVQSLVVLGGGFVLYSEEFFLTYIITKVLYITL